MTDHIEINLQNWEERAAIHARDATGEYMLDRLRAGEDSLYAIEAAELGDVSGKRVLHLQCHIGQNHSYPQPFFLSTGGRSERLLKTA